MVISVNNVNRLMQYKVLNLNDNNIVIESYDKMIALLPTTCKFLDVINTNHFVDVATTILEKYTKNLMYIGKMHIYLYNNKYSLVLNIICDPPIITEFIMNKKEAIDMLYTLYREKII